MQLNLANDFNQAFSGNPKQIFAKIMALKGQAFRKVKTRETLRFAVGKKFYFSKKHFGVGYKELIKNLLQLRLPIFGAKNELLAINKLNELNIPTMTIAGFGQKGLSPVSRHSFLVTKELENTISLEHLCAAWPKQPPGFGFKQSCLKKVAEIARTLHQNGVNHRDFYICHFLLDQAKADLTLYLIDLHRVQIRPKVPERWLVKDLAGLYFSAMDIGLTKRDILRFLEIYFAASWREVLQTQQHLLQKIAKRARKLYNKEHYGN